ncbi:MAG: ABC transporter permease [Spirochaetaceae bacterium]|jgi:phospholipid/cholesterol/gamma-HCH transport system permease protein|nr:ABC transporter permease [Spirochaetaceae bacterium]
MMKLRIPVVDSLLYTLGLLSKILCGVGYFMLRGRVSYKILIMQILFTFVEALAITACLALGIGAAVNIIGMQFLANISQEKQLYLVLICITREVGPLFTAIIVIARSGTAIATEIAGMVISHEVEAYISIGIDPVEHLGVPRFLGVTISLFLLNIYFSLFGLAGSFAVAALFNSLAASTYFGNLLQVLTVYDILILIIKSFVLGMTIAILSLIAGFGVERASTEIPIAGLKAVSSSLVWCILLDILLSALYYITL